MSMYASVQVYFSNMVKYAEGKKYIVDLWWQDTLKYRGYLSRQVVFRLAIDVKTADFELNNHSFFYENCRVFFEKK